MLVGTIDFCHFIPLLVTLTFFFFFIPNYISEFTIFGEIFLYVTVFNPTTVELDLNLGPQDQHKAELLASFSCTFQLNRMKSGVLMKQSKLNRCTPELHCAHYLDFEPWNNNQSLSSFLLPHTHLQVGDHNLMMNITMGSCFWYSKCSGNL